MKNKRICKTLSALCLTMVVAFGFTIPAFAQGSEQAPVAPAEDSTNDSNVIVEEAIRATISGKMIKGMSCHGKGQRRITFLH